MNRMQSQVAAFHALLGHPIGKRPELSRPALRIALVAEEAGEFCGAIAAVRTDVGSLAEILSPFEKGFRSGILSARSDGAIVATADAIADLLYVTIGAAVEFGIDVEPIFDEVHRANMTKIGGASRADGKTLKPEGWQPPNVRREIARQLHRVAGPGWICTCGHPSQNSSAFATHLENEGAL